jgi:8-hydroxy-5-deazaflavin:NADPH oxidoreductase
MQIGILGTGMVGRALAEGFVRTGHDVSLGTRDVHETMIRQLDGAPASIAEWLAENPSVALADFASVAAAADVVVNATNGSATLAALTDAGAENLAGKVVIDVSNPLDFSRGFPPTLTVKDTDSLGEQVQRAFPEARVVKSLNTLTAALMVDPGMLPEPTTVFLSGNDPTAKATVAGLLGEFGWTDILDLGDITTARGTEMWLPLWLRIMGTVGGGRFNLRIVR